MPALIQSSFAKGEIAPGLYGRVDVAAYFVALRTAFNCIIHRFGGISNRAGTDYLGPVKDHDATAPLLIPFQQKTTDSYILEFGDEYMRVIRNDAHVLEAAKTIVSVTQASPGVFEVTGHGYSDGDEVFLAMTDGMLELNGRRAIVDSSSTDEFELIDQLTGVAIATTTFSAFSAGAVSKVFELATPFAGDDITEENILKFVQDADVMTLTHKLYAPRELSRTGHTTWTLEEIDFTPWTFAAPLAISVTPAVAAAVTYAYKVTALERDTLEESLSGVFGNNETITSATSANPAVFTLNSHDLLDGDECGLNTSGAWNALNFRRFLASDVTANTFRLKYEDTGDYVDSSGGGLGAMPASTALRRFVCRITNGHATTNNEIAWAVTTGAERYSVYKYDNGSYGLIGTTASLEFTDDGITADLTQSPPRLRNPFAEDGDFPNCAGFFQQRREFAGTENDPDKRVWSQTGAHSNFNISSPIRDDDAITARLSSQDVQEVRWLVPDDDEILEFTSSTEWRTSSGPEARFSIDTISSRPQTDWGVAFHLQPIKIGGVVLFAEDGAKRVRAFGYSFQDDKYGGPEVSLLAAHLLKKYGIVSWAFQRKPEPRLYAVREDGALLTLTFDSDQEVQAWTWWRTKGKFKRVAVLRNPSGQVGTEDGVYFVIQRTVGGTTRNYIEKLSSREFDDPRECKFVDGGVSYDNPITVTGITISGPITVTAAAHALEDGNEVEFSDIQWIADFDERGTETQPDQLNNTRYFVANATTDTFTINDENGTPITGEDFNAYAEGGVVRKCASSFLGFEHLEGELVVGLVDGNVFRDLEVIAGRITLPDGITAARAFFGLSYIAEVETLDLEAGDGTIQGYSRSIDKVMLRFENTRSLWVGPDASRLNELKMRTDEDLGEPIALLTGDKEVELNSGWDTKGRILMRQLDPVPFTLLAAIPTLEIGG